MDAYSVIYAGNDLSLAPGVELYNHDFNKLADRDIKINKLARQDRSIITSSEYTSKEIPVYLEVCGGSRSETEQRLTYLKSLLQGQNQVLKVSQSGDTVSYTATMNELSETWEGINVQVVVIFLASDPIGESETLTTIFSSTITTGSTSLSGVIGGSFMVEPTINIVINSVTGGTGSISVRNAGTQQGITITGTFAATNIVSINSKAQIVTINGVEQDFTGRFPVFYPGTQALGYSDTFTTRSVSLTAQARLRLV